MYTLGDKYLIPELKCQAGASFRFKVRWLCENSLDSLIGVDEEISNAISIIYDDVLESE